MGSEWPRVTLEEIAEVVDSRHKTPIYSDEGLPMVRVVDVKGGQLQLDGTKKVSPEVYDDFSKGRDPQIFDLVISRVGSYGNVAYIDTLDKFCLGQNTALIIPQNKDRFLYHSLRSTQVKAQIEEMVVGAVQKTISLKTIKSLIVPDPPMQQRKNIDIFLSSLDDKIQLNHQTNQTLEQMAQALFKSWFVDFDPVIDNALEAGNAIPDELQDRAERRKQQLAKPDHQPLPDDVRQLFPSEFELTDELGWVPMGWEVKPLGASFELLGGHSFKSSSYHDDGSYGVVTIRNVQDGVFIQECANRILDIPEKMKAHCSLSKGDVLLSLTGNVGRVCVVSEGDYLLNQRVAKIIGKDAIPQSVAYFFFRQDSLYKEMITIAKGTAQQNLSPIETIKIKSVLPSNLHLAKLSRTFEELFEKMTENTVQSQTLTNLRDTLLPKLISGELRLPSDTEQQPDAANS